MEATISQQLVDAAKTALTGGAPAVVEIGTVIIGIYAAIKLLQIVRSSMGK